MLGKALSDIPALKPYRGKPAVRNFRGGDGNVGIIRSPVRAIALPYNSYDEFVRWLRSCDCEAFRQDSSIHLPVGDPFDAASGDSFELLF